MSNKLYWPVLASVALASMPSMATITLLKDDKLTFTTSGFIETDVIVDSTRSFNEIIGNNPVALPSTANGSNARTMISIRNSRLAFGAEYKPTEDWTTRGYLEFDLFGFDPTAPGATGATNTEQGFFVNPTVRVRHAYMKGENNGWTFLAGQTWQLFAWQPYYFETTVDILPIPALPYSRTPQMRIGKTGLIADQTHLEGSIAMNRPPQRDSALPEFQAGVRASYDGWRGVANGGSTGKSDAQPLSVGVSGLYRDIKIPAPGSTTDTVSFPATALAVNAFVPILSATENNFGNSLSLLGGWTTGRGYGDEFSGWTGGTAGNLTNAFSTANTTNAALPNNVTNHSGTNTNLDGGIGDYDVNGTFQLIQLQSFHADLEYVLPLEMPTWIDLGYGRLTSNNMAYLTPAVKGGNPVASGGGIPYVREDGMYANIFHDCTRNIRVGFEFLRVRTQYADSNVAFNNRYQFSSFFLF